MAQQQLRKRHATLKFRLKGFVGIYRVRILGGWVYRMRRVLATLCIGVIAVLVGYKAIFGPNGMMVYRAKKAQYQKLQQDIEREQTENQRLQHQVDVLKSDPNAIEKEAREQLGFVKPGDFVLLQPQPKLDAKLPPPPPDPK